MLSSLCRCQLQNCFGKWMARMWNGMGPAAIHMDSLCEYICIVHLLYSLVNLFANMQRGNIGCIIISNRSKYFIQMCIYYNHGSRPMLVVHNSWCDWCMYRMCILFWYHFSFYMLPSVRLVYVDTACCAITNNETKIPGATATCV